MRDVGTQTRGVGWHCDEPTRLHKPRARLCRDSSDMLTSVVTFWKPTCRIPAKSSRSVLSVSLHRSRLLDASKAWTSASVRRAAPAWASRTKRGAFVRYTRPKPCASRGCASRDHPVAQTNAAAVDDVTLVSPSAGQSTGCALASLWSVTCHLCVRNGPAKDGPSGWTRSFARERDAKFSGQSHCGRRRMDTRRRRPPERSEGRR